MPDFRLRQLGRSGLEVSPICLGGNVFGWTVDESMSFRLLDAWVDAGMNFVDTADVYSRWVPGHAGGESETILGKWFRQSGKRNRVVLATKVGKPMGDNDKGLSSAYIRRAVRPARADVGFPAEQDGAFLESARCPPPRPLPPTAKPRSAF